MNIGIVGVGGGGIKMLEYSSKYFGNEVMEKNNFLLIDTDQRTLSKALLDIYKNSEDLLFFDEGDVKRLPFIEAGNDIVREGCAGDMELGGVALRTSMKKVREYLENFDTIFLCFSAGGGTGSNSYKIAKNAKLLGKRVYSFISLRKDSREIRRIIKETSKFSDFVVIAGSERINLGIKGIENWGLLQKSFGYLIYSLYKHKEKLNGFGSMSVVDDASPEALIDRIEDYNTGYFSFNESERIICYTGYQGKEELYYNKRRIIMRYNEGSSIETIFLGII